MAIPFVLLLVEAGGQDAMNTEAEFVYTNVIAS